MKKGKKPGRAGESSLRDKRGRFVSQKPKQRPKQPKPKPKKPKPPTKPPKRPVKAVRKPAKVKPPKKAQKPLRKAPRDARGRFAPKSPPQKASRPKAPRDARGRFAPKTPPKKKSVPPPPKKSGALPQKLKDQISRSAKRKVDKVLDPSLTVKEAEQVAAELGDQYIEAGPNGEPKVKPGFEAEYNFIPRKTTVERVHRYDHKLDKEALERRTHMGTAGANTAFYLISQYLKRLETHYDKRGFGVRTSIAKNADNTVDGVIVIVSEHEFIERSEDGNALDVDSLSEAEVLHRAGRILHDIPAVIGRYAGPTHEVNDEVWYSLGMDFSSVEAGFGQDILGGSPPINVNPFEVLDEPEQNRWRRDRFAIGWQRGAARVFSHVAGALDAMERIYSRFASIFIVPKAFVLKFSWNPWLAQPPALRLPQ